MLVLALDTSSAATVVALASVDAEITRVAGRKNVDPRAHAEVLAGSIRDCLEEAGVGPGDLAAIVAGVGPGPYTGLRVGLVTAAALGDGLQIPTYGVCSLDGIGLAVGAPRLLVAGDARRREVYWASYDDGVRVSGPDVSRPGDIDVAGFSAAAGAGARQYGDVFGLPLLDQDYPDPMALIRAAESRIREHAASERLGALYLRSPDAIEPGPRKTVRT